MSHQDAIIPLLTPPTVPKPLWEGCTGHLGPKSLSPRGCGMGTPAPSTASHCQPRHLGGRWGPPAGRAPQPWPCGAHSTGSSCRWLQVDQWGWLSSCPSSASSGLNNSRHQPVRQGGRWRCFLGIRHPQPSWCKNTSRAALGQDRRVPAGFLPASGIALTLCHPKKSALAPAPCTWERCGGQEPGL